ncbi:MAG: HAD hydrolase-like protein [Candidatus Eremiobacteraeota bacterium]|nr:HAD hydrolase-like protein [Candidatus Eremiobacteraeota bacterium]
MILHIWTAQDQKNQNDRLNEVVERIRAKTESNVSTLAIFDLDGTLLDNRPRTIFILREISEKFEERLPQLVEAFDRFYELSAIEYSIEETLKKFNIRDENEITFIKSEWEKRFFTDEYQKFDIPLPGAKSYVNRIYDAGATVIYLTGRDVGRMLVGTTDSLRLFGFPVGVVGTMTIVKKEFAEKDEVFKKDVVTYLKRLGKVEAVFENEPVNSNILRREFPEASSFLVLTQHRPDAPQLEQGIHAIRDFRIRQ